MIWGYWGGGMAGQCGVLMMILLYFYFLFFNTHKSKVFRALTNYLTLTLPTSTLKYFILQSRKFISWQHFTTSSFFFLPHQFPQITHCFTHILYPTLSFTKYLTIPKFIPFIPFVPIPHDVCWHWIKVASRHLHRASRQRQKKVILPRDSSKLHDLRLSSGEAYE